MQIVKKKNIIIKDVKIIYKSKAILVYQRINNYNFNKLYISYIRNILSIQTFKINKTITKITKKVSKID